MRFLISKIVAVFFSVTTVILFILSREGRLFDMAGSVETGVALYLLNAFLLVISLVVFIWLRAHKDLPQKQKSKILEAYAEIEANRMNDLPSIPTQNDVILQLLNTDEAITLQIEGETKKLQVGDNVQLVSAENTHYRIVAVIVSMTNSALNVRRKNI